MFSGTKTLINKVNNLTVSQKCFQHRQDTQTVVFSRWRFLKDCVFLFLEETPGRRLTGETTTVHKLSPPGGARCWQASEAGASLVYASDPDLLTPAGGTPVQR